MSATLATASRDGQPSARIVLIRGFDERGFVFYTNSLSAKGRQLSDNAAAALCFFWDELDEQLRVEGPAGLVTSEESDAYWQTRPRDSQIGAWASDQSQALDNIETLAARFADCEGKYANQPVPRPPHWHGFRITPSRIEFWSRGEARLHRRVVHELKQGEWTQRMLYP